jgi:leader peptidase (prepilin peptidase) / N-methyltransferase
MPEICYFKKDLSLTQSELRIGEDTFKPENVPHMELVTSELVLPREAMGLGDVKFMAAIGAFIGWQASIFTFFGGALIGCVVALYLIATGRREKSGRLAFGPLLVAAATIWIFLPPPVHQFWRAYLRLFGYAISGGGPGAPGI